MVTQSVFFSIVNLAMAQRQVTFAGNSFVFVIIHQMMVFVKPKQAIE
jgi:hypothetical protein